MKLHICQFCSKELKLEKDKNAHEQLCKLNPNRRQHHRLGKTGGNQFTKAQKLGVEWTISENTRNKLSDFQKGEKSFWCKPGNELSRKQLSDSMKLAVVKFPESYSSSNRGRTKQIIIDGLKLQGQWEVDFYNWCKSKSIKIDRPMQSFDYEFDGIRKYFPDFFLPDYSLFVEVKGYETEKDMAKWRDFPHKLLIVRKADILQIRRNKFSLPESS